MKKLSAAICNHKHNLRPISSIILLLIFFQSFFFHQLIFATDENEILIEPLQPSITVTSGQVINTYITINNNNSKTIDFNVTYLSNLQPDEHTIGLWHFEEESGKIIDETHKYNGTVQGATWNNGKFGKALKFDGIDDYAVVQNFQNITLDSLTIETWIKIESLDYWTPIGGVKYESFGLIYRDDGVFRTHVWGQEQGLKWYDTYAQIDIGEWHYVVMTYDSLTGELSWYLDGIKIDSRFEGRDVINTGPFNLVFGRGWTETMWYLLNGSIDEVRISNISRSKIEIAENYRRAISGEGEWLRFDETSGQISPNSTYEYEITLDALKLNPGTYKRDLVIKTNNSNKPYNVLPITLEVLPAIHDIAIREMFIPEISLASNPTPIVVEITNYGSYNETEIMVLLFINGELEDTYLIPKINIGQTTQLSMIWTPTKTGIHYVTLSAAPFQEDNVRENNIFLTPVSIIGYPDIWVNETSLELSIEKRGMATKSFKIGNNGTDTLTYQVTDNYSPEIFIDDMEHGESGWIHEGNEDSWELGQPTIGPNKAYSGCCSWGTDLSGNYDDLTNSSLISPVINLKNRIQPSLIFNHWYSINYFGDHGFVEIWDGTKWHTLNTEGYSGSSRDWVQDSYDLSLFNDKEIRVRFRLESDEHVIEKGWFIDDVLIIDKADSPEDNIVESPDSGEIYPDSYQNITITVNGTNLKSGSYKEFIIVRSNDPDESRITIPFTISIFNVTGNGGLPPFEIGPDMEVNEDEIVVFDGSRSYDNVNILDYTWTFLDEGLQILKGVSPTYVFETPGIYEMTLIVTDYTGNQASDNITITVKDITKPSPDAGEDLKTNAANIIVFNGGNSQDNSEIVSYEWDFGDGATGSGIEVIHSYSKPGTYNVTLTIRDIEGNIDKDWLQVSVSPAQHIFYLQIISIGFVLLIIWSIYREFILRTMR